MKWPDDLVCGTIRTKKQLSLSVIFVSHCRRERQKAVELLKLGKKCCRIFLLGNMAEPFEAATTGDVLLVSRSKGGKVQVAKVNDLKDMFREPDTTWLPTLPRGGILVCNDMSRGE